MITLCFLPVAMLVTSLTYPPLPPRPRILIGLSERSLSRVVNFGAFYELVGRLGEIGSGSALVLSIAAYRFSELRRADESFCRLRRAGGSFVGLRSAFVSLVRLRKAEERAVDVRSCGREELWRRQREGDVVKRCLDRMAECNIFVYLFIWKNHQRDSEISEVSATICRQQSLLCNNYFR